MYRQVRLRKIDVKKYEWNEKQIIETDSYSQISYSLIHKYSRCFKNSILGLVRKSSYLCVFNVWNYVKYNDYIRT